LIRLVRCAVVIGVVGLGLLALRSAPPAAIVQPAVTAPTAPPTTPPTPPPRPTLSAALPPQSNPIISRNVRETPAPRPTLSTTVLDVAAVEFSYQPARLTVRPGATVTFRNRGSEGHDVLGSGPDGSWWSGPLAPTESFQRQFAALGDYDYWCSFHAEMRGRITVSE
jgi:plastocyanin